MCISTFFAQLIGVYLFILSLAMLIHATRFKKTMHEFLANSALMAFAGGISLILGLVIVISHNIWVTEWPILITLVGWLLIFQGVMRIIFPDATAKIWKDMMVSSAYTLVSWVVLLVSIYLLWAGFAN